MRLLGHSGDLFKPMNFLTIVKRNDSNVWSGSFASIPARQTMSAHRGSSDMRRAIRALAATESPKAARKSRSGKWRGSCSAIWGGEALAPLSHRVVPASEPGPITPVICCRHAMLQQGHLHFPSPLRHGVWVPAFAGTTLMVWCCPASKSRHCERSEAIHLTA
jgi:hypothetical protein